jgi:hypothetical protein
MAIFQFPFTIACEGLSSPEAAAVDGSGDVFVAEPSFASIVEIVVVNGPVNSSSLF